MWKWNMNETTYGRPITTEKKWIIFSIFFFSVLCSLDSGDNCCLRVCAFSLVLSRAQHLTKVVECTQPKPNAINVVPARNKFYIFSSLGFLAFDWKRIKTRKLNKSMLIRDGDRLSLLLTLLSLATQSFLSKWHLLSIFSCFFPFCSTKHMIVTTNENFS